MKSMMVHQTDATACVGKCYQAEAQKDWQLARQSYQTSSILAPTRLQVNRSTPPIISSYYLESAETRLQAGYRLPLGVWGVRGFPPALLFLHSTYN